jgi:hypothetical protein
MGKLFAENLQSYIESTVETIKGLLADLTCDRVVALTPEELESMFMRNRLLGAPTFVPEPIHKKLSDDGQNAEYYHPVTSGHSLQYKPNPCQVLYAPYSVEVGPNEIALRVPVHQSDVDRARETHRDLVEFIRKNVSQLTRDVPNANAEIVARGNRALMHRREECERRARQERAL